MSRHGDDVSGMVEVNELGCNGIPDLLPDASVDLPELSKGLRLPVDRVHKRMISREYVLSTAGHQARSGGTRYIFASQGLASCRRRPLSSNVRRRNPPSWQSSIDNTYHSLIITA